MLFLFAFGAGALNESDISAKSAVIINAQTLEIVFEKNAYEKRSMASTTKIMTGILACESGKLGQTVEITPQMCAVEGTAIGLKAGYKITLYNLLCGLMLESGNDAANAVAFFLGGSLENFAKMMNEKAFEIGMKCTNFVTPSGLDDEHHYTTAYDMALLGAYAMRNPILKEICSKRTQKADFINPELTVMFSNHNRLLSSYDGAYGIKTGFTKKSGRCLVSAAQRAGADFICVTLSAGDDWNDHIKMFDYAFETASTVNVIPRIPDSMEIKGGVFSCVKIKSSVLAITQRANKEITQKVYLPRFLYAPVKCGDVIGQIQYFSGDKNVGCADITAAEDCQSVEATFVKKRSLTEKLKEKFLRFFGR